MIAARTVGGPAYPEMIEEVGRELTKVIEDFDRAMNFEALRLANMTSTLSFPNPSTVDPHWLGADRAEQERVEREQVWRERVRVGQNRVGQDRLFWRFEPVEEGSQRKIACMDGIVQTVVDHIMR